MNADTFSVQGTTHRINQDYAMSVATEDEVAIIVSDGCSSAVVNGVNNTDTGTRLLARAVAQHVFQPPLDDNSHCQRVLTTANYFRKAMSLERESLFATLMVAHATPSAVHIRVIGDGTVVVRRRTGQLIFFDIKFPNGAPYYLQYEYDPNYRNMYRNNLGGANYTVERTIVEPDKIKTDSWNGFVPLTEEEFTKNPEGYFSLKLTIDPLGNDLIVLMSDGISQCIRHEVEGVTKTPVVIPMRNVAEPFLAFKSYHGEFVHKRAGRVMKQFREDGWQNMDDLTMAAIYIPDKKAQS